MAEEPPSGIKSRRSCSLVNTLLMFGEGAISSSELFAAGGSSFDLSPDPDRVVPEAFFSFRELWTGEGSLPLVGSMFLPHEREVVRGSIADIACEGGGVHSSTIIQSKAGAGETCDTSALPLSGVFVRSGILILSGVLALSGVLDCSNVLPRSGFGECPHPDLADRSVFFRRTWDERVHSGTGVFSQSGFLPDSAGLEVPAC